MRKRILLLFCVILSLRGAAQIVETKPDGHQVLVFEELHSIYDTLTPEAKIFGLSTFWKEASYNFVFFDKLKFNWDSLYYSYLSKVLAAKNIYEYSKVLSEFARTLNDGHTSVYTPDFFWKDIGRPRIQWEKVENRNFVSRIDETLLNEIPIGTELTAVNDLPFDEFIASGNSLNGIKGTTLTFTFRSDDGKQFKKTMTHLAGKDHSVKSYPPLKPWTDFELKTLSNNVTYVKINHFENEGIPVKFQEAIARINNSTAVIIDIRENGGGNTDHAIGVAQHLTDKPFIVGSAWRTRIHKGANKAWGSSALFGNTSEWTKSNFNYFNGTEWEYHAADTIEIEKSTEKVKVPIYILIGERTFSAAEDFLILLDGSENITLIGQHTAGSSGQPLLIELPHGLMARVCAKRDTYPDGRDFIGIGISPDILVKRTVADYKRGVDTELNAALEAARRRR